jgi:hypothetical protein
VLLWKLTEECFKKKEVVNTVESYTQVKKERTGKCPFCLLRTVTVKLERGVWVRINYSGSLRNQETRK